MIDPRLFKLVGDKFIRQTDMKEIATLVDGEVTGLHHKQEKFRETLESLIGDASPVEVEVSIKKPKTKRSKKDAPAEYFTKRMGGKSEQVVEWRCENWSAKQFKDEYGDLFTEENL